MNRTVFILFCKCLLLGYKAESIYLSRPNIVGGQTRFCTSNMSEFLQKSRSIVQIKNDRNNMCFSFAFVLGLAHLADKSLYDQFVRHSHRGIISGNNIWTQLAVGLHCDILELDV